MKILLTIVVNAIAIWVATLIVPGVSISEGTTTDRVLTYVGVGAVLGVVNSFVKPIVKVLGFPFIVLSLGLLLFVVNALMLVLTEWLSHRLGLSFEIDDFFWSAIGAAIVVSVVTWALHLVLPDGD